MLFSHGFIPGIPKGERAAGGTIWTPLYNCLEIREQVNTSTPLKPWDRTGLLASADRLKGCEHTLQSIGYLEEINSADNLRQIVQRLPFHLPTKFVELADQIQRAGQRTNISHIAEFVKVKARAVNNPVFGCMVDVARDRSENSTGNPKGGASSVERLSSPSTRLKSFLLSRRKAKNVQTL